MEHPITKLTLSRLHMSSQYLPRKMTLTNIMELAH